MATGSEKIAPLVADFDRLWGTGSRGGARFWKSRKGWTSAPYLIAAKRIRPARPLPDLAVALHPAGPRPAITSTTLFMRCPCLRIGKFAAEMPQPPQPLFTYILWRTASSNMRGWKVFVCARPICKRPDILPMPVFILSERREHFIATSPGFPEKVLCDIATSRQNRENTRYCD